MSLYAVHYSYSDDTAARDEHRTAHREFLATLAADGVVMISGPYAAVDEAPESLLAAVRGTLTSLSEPARDALRCAALLGNEFSVGDVAAVTGTAPHDLVQVLDEAVTAHVVVGTERDLAFRHPYLRQALAESIPTMLRPSLRRHAAQALAHVGAPTTRVGSGPPSLGEDPGRVADVRGDGDPSTVSASASVSVSGSGATGAQAGASPVSAATTAASATR